MSEFSWPTGPISIRVTSDLLFKHLLQDSENLLRELICSLLHLDPSDINKTEVTNPILLGQELDEKTVILDVNVLMNDNTNIDLEMQVINYGNWIERSVFYSTRNFGDLKSGDPYEKVKPSIHIGFLAFSPFEDYEKFYSLNQLMDTEDHHVYTEKLAVGYVDMTRIELATDIDKHYNIDKWAKFFKATTWEEICMLVQEYPIMEEAASNLRRLSEEERFKLQQEAWEDRQRCVNGLRMQLDQAKKEADEAKKETAIARKEADVFRQQLIEAGITPKE